VARIGYWTTARALVAAAVLGALGTLPSGALAADGQTFQFTGHAETYTVPDGVSYVHIEAAGGNGGPGWAKRRVVDGILVSARYMPVTPGAQLRVVVGGNGEASTFTWKAPNAKAYGGFNGGGDGVRGGGGGGGFSSVQEPDGSYLVIAGGAGGGAKDAAGGPQNPPGTLDGQNGGGSLGTPQGGGGGTLTGGGHGGHNASPLVRDGNSGQRFSGGDGGIGLSPKSKGGGAGGGGGYYGGGGGAGSEGGSGGGGGAGSSYIDPEVQLITTTHKGDPFVTITPAAVTPAAGLTVEVPPTVEAGRGFDVTITATDASGARHTGYRGTVHLTSSVPGALPEDYQFTAPDEGRHTFHGAARFLKAGPITITATDLGDRSTTATAGSIVHAAALDRIVVTPTHLVVDRPTAIHAEGYDAYDNGLGDVSSQAEVRLWPEPACPSSGGRPVCVARFTDAVGEHVLSATVGSVTGIAHVSVTDKVRSSLALHADPERGSRGGTTTFTVTARNGTADIPAPTGTVDIYDAKTKLASAELTSAGDHSTAVAQIRGLGGGDHEISAVYGGDAANIGSRATLSYRVGAQPTRVAIIPTADPAPVGTTPAFRVAVQTDTPIPEMVSQGTVLVIADGDSEQRFTVHAADVGKAMTFPKRLTPGNHVIVAHYQGTSDFAGSVGSITQRVAGDGTPTTIAVMTSDATPEDMQPITLSATVSAGDRPAAGGSVIFTIDGHQFGPQVSVSDGRATTAPAVVAAGLGDHTVAAHYLPPTGLAPSSASLPGGLEVHPATTRTTIETSAPRIDAGGPVTFTATVATRWHPAEGRVQFAIDDRAVDEPSSLQSGRAVIRIEPKRYGDRLTPGTHVISATFQPYNARTLRSVADLRQQVGAARDTTTQVSSSDEDAEFGRPVTFTATVSADGGDDPSGEVQFAIDGVAFGDPVDLVDGQARSAPTRSLALGDHRITATYAGQGFDFAPSSGTLERQTVVAARTQTTVRSSANPFERSDRGPVPVFTITVDAAGGTPTGAIEFSLDGYSTRVPLVDGRAIVNLPQAVVLSDLDVGLHHVRARFDSDTSSFRDSSDTLEQAVR
jgi:hypothetical protein